ncbi:hypothetical protein OIU84_013591 [Salix udensis]|uniref:STAS domain-containing protein n=1 Tax=Salix udensis TaxID=889485 RepID=A0AAD6JIE9_9ROSI|nr:hypothetical protein OIU84_013591 [Salix udensis]
MRSVFSQTHQWRWESAVLGFGFLFFLLTTRYFSKRKPKYFWVSAMAPLTSVILGSLLVYLTHAEKHGVQVIGNLKKGLNPMSFTDLVFVSPYLSTAIKTGIITGVIALAEGNCSRKKFCYVQELPYRWQQRDDCFWDHEHWPFSRSAVNYNAGCKTAVSNIVMALGVMVTLLFLTPLFHYTPLVVLSSIIVSAMLGLLDYEAAIHLWSIDKFDFMVCISAYAGVVFASVEIGLVIAVAISLLRLLLFVARPKTFTLGNIPNSMIYRNVEQYPNTISVPGVLILEIDAPIYFANSGYLRERIARWVDDEEVKLKSSGETSLQYVILDMGAVGNIDTSGIGMLEEVKKVMDRKGVKLVLANPGAEVMKKLDKAKFIENIGHQWIHLTVGEAVAACDFMLHTFPPDPLKEDSEAFNKV